MIKLLQEPLVSFLLLGFILYLYYTNVAQDDVSEDTKVEISVTPYEIQTLKKEYTKKYDKKISEEELTLYIQDLYRQKVLLEESIRLNLHKSDTLIVKRLVEKMEFILLGSVEYTEPSETQLYEYYMKNIEDYSELKRVSFVHIYFSDVAKMNVLYNLARFGSLSPSGVKNFGEPFQGSLSYRNISYQQVQKKFGKYFASKLFKLKKGVWHKGLHSKYGVHLVYITDKISTHPYKFDEVEARVYDDYLAQRTDKIIKKAYKDILQNYNLGEQK
ncbi:peptidyl-prolyl cis-trans isomerase [Sulfurimonas sp. SAG-AH-194-L11]|nr:peptidylprolyl isomerase [Sulfurimonas sp. SAG-AH-194-L11]MDF1877484.1 peptidyl-prolyl cis-trans isomerase [Sulfurimonas sp. SAG-AH-194-L11]